MLSYLFDFQKSMECFKGNFIVNMWSKNDRKKMESDPILKLSQHLVWNLTFNFYNNSSSWLPFELKIWSLLSLLMTNIRWILISSLIIFIFLIKWVLIGLGKQTLRWYMRHLVYIYVPISRKKTIIWNYRYC